MGSVATPGTIAKVRPVDEAISVTRSLARREAEVAMFVSDEAKAAVEILRDEEAGGDPRADLFREAAKD